MGSKSDSSNKQHTTNTNIQQSWTDNSQRDESINIDWRNEGVLAGATMGDGANINYTVTDGGAFDLAREAGAAMRDVSLESLMSFRGVAGDAMSGMSDVSKYAIAENSDVARDFGNYIAQSTMNQINNNSDLVRALSDDIRETSGDAMNTVVDQTRYALQFADASTRSDGQQLAVATNKTMMIGLVVVGVLGVAFIAVKGKK